MATGMFEALHVTSPAQGVVVVNFGRRELLDQMQILKIESELERLIHDAHQPRLVVDLDAVERMSSTFIGVMFSLAAAISDRGGQLRVAGVDEGLRSILTTTQFDRLVPIHRTVDQAVGSLS